MPRTREFCTRASTELFLSIIKRTLDDFVETLTIFPTIHSETRTGLPLFRPAFDPLSIIMVLNHGDGSRAIT